MRPKSAVLLALAVLIPTFGQAQTRVGVVSEAGLGITAAPVPALNAPAPLLSPAALTPALLSAAVAAPAPLIVAPALLASPAPKAAQVVIDSPKANQHALAQIKPAAAQPEKTGSDEARAAGTALFDGAAKLSAPAIGDGPSVPGSAPEDRRSSGLSPPTNAEISAAYRRAHPKSKAVDTFGADFVAAASETIQKYTFMGEHFLQQLNPDGEGVFDFRGRAIYRAAADLVGLHEARDSAPAREFLQLLGRWHAHKDYAQETVMSARTAMMRRLGRGPAVNLPPSPIPRGEYWDMAAGMNAQGFIHREIDASTHYSFFDYSPFVVSYLRTAAALAGAKNVSVVEGDINKLTRPAQPLAVLRTKNAVNYVPGFERKLEEMADWIAPGGQLIIQNDPNPAQRSTIISKHGPLIRRLIAAGWEIEYGFSGRPGKFSEYGLDTLILTRPRLAWEKTPVEADAAWRAYAAAVAKADAEFNPFGFLFR